MTVIEKNRERQLNLGAFAAWIFAAATVALIAFANGGYDVVRLGEIGLPGVSFGEVGIAVWWAVLVGTLIGALRVVRLRSFGGVLAGLLAALAVWIALSLNWTESVERTMVELARIATYLGVLVLGLALKSRGHGRPLVNGTTVGIGVVIVIAALSRLEPNWFPEQRVAEFLPDIELESRLAYPINYSSGLAALCAIGLPLFLRTATSGRTLPGRALAAGTLPLAVLVLWLTGSSLSLPLAAVAVVAYLVLARERIPAIASLALAGLGGAVLILAADSRELLDRGLTTPEALSQGDELLVIAIIVSALVGAGQVALGVAFRRWPRLRGPLVPRQVVRAGLAALIAVVAVGGLVAAATGELSDRFEAFKSAEGLDPDEGARGEQVLDVSARGRYQYWEAAVDAYGTEPVLGIGPGTFEYYWAREGDPDAAIFVRDAHSLYLEMLAELGPLGFLLVVGFIAAVLIAGAIRTFRARDEDRSILAAAVAGCVAFAAAAAVDWIWELAALGAVFMLLAAVVVADERSGRAASTAGRIATAGLAVLGLIAVAVPFTATSLVERSREAVAEDRLDDALQDARDAVAVQPSAARPRIQEANVLELMGDVGGALVAAREATDREPTNWRLWIVRSRLEARAGNAEAAVDAFTEAQSLFPRGVEAPE